VNGFRRKKKDKNDVETMECAAGLATAVAKNSSETITYLMGHRLMGFEKSGNFYRFVTDSLSSDRPQGGGGGRQGVGRRGRGRNCKASSTLIV
jgi:hypothetical protein